MSLSRTHTITLYGCLLQVSTKRVVKVKDYFVVADWNLEVERDSVCVCERVKDYFAVADWNLEVWGERDTQNREESERERERK